MAIKDWFKKAKEAKKEAKKPPKNEYGNQGAGSEAYKEAQQALKDLEGVEVASDD